MSQIDSGLGQLSSKSPELVGGINKLYTGVESYTVDWILANVVALSDWALANIWLERDTILW